MILRNQQTQTADEDTRSKWFNSPVTFHEGTLADIRRFIPDFERRGFGLTRLDNESTRLNEHLDTIVRRPFRDDPNFIPIGVVSKDYNLVPHTAVLDLATQVLNNAKIRSQDVKAEIEITEYGERMALSLYLPDKYQFDPGDGYPMALRLECRNSVDGSTRFQAFISWFRFVCSNGLIVGVTRSGIRRRHVGNFDLTDIGLVLGSGLNEIETEKKNFERWQKIGITLTRLIPWAENDLRKGWGFKAAARAFHIARCGSDVEIVGQYKDQTPTTIAVREIKRVPGTPPRCKNVFDVCQILAWLAKERRDVHEQLEWREQIPDLLSSLN